MPFRTFLLLFLNVPFVVMLRFEKPAAAKLWSQYCSKNEVAMNDCNWCHCNKKNSYTCKARACAEVDMFGHFNDAIREIDVGMQGHGVWRSSETVCEPGVHYRKDDLLCVCDENGKWPNPVCRDIFRILHSVETTTYKEPLENQTCSATKLYLFDCNVCFCPSSEKIDPKLCTKRECEDEDTKTIERTNTKDTVEEVYATCDTNNVYKLGCQTCTCLKNNRLLCDNCTNTQDNPNWLAGPKSECYLKKPGVVFEKDCNFCHCDKNETIYCTAKKCLRTFTEISLPKLDYDLVDPIEDENHCVPQTKYKLKDGNTCHCFMLEGVKYSGCSVNKCKGSSDLHNDTTCVVGTSYKVNCLICHCVVEKGIKREYCTIDNSCVSNNENELPRKLSSMHGYCEPMHVYQQNCNKCRCLADGKTVACTSKICSKRKGRSSRNKNKNLLNTRSELAAKSEGEPPEEGKALIVEFIPFVQKGEVCPKGQKYNMVDCNICYCLNNGNAICTTKQC